MTGRAVAKLADWPRGPSVLELRVRWLLGVTVAIANLGGALVVLLFVMVVIPDPQGIPHRHYVQLVNLAEFFSYPVIAVPFVLYIGMRMFRPIHRLARDSTGVPDKSQRRAVLLAPLRLTILQGATWGAGAIAWAALNVRYSGLLALKIGLTCLLGAITTCALVYLLTEWLMRPAAALVLASRPARLSNHFSVTTRVMLAWSLGTAVPMVGSMAVALAAVAVPGMGLDRLAYAVLGLGLTGLIAGFGVTYVAARAVGDPIRTVRVGMARVERGDLDAEVEVYDATEVGLLQTGFNTMVRGLRERERLRDLFGRHVGEDVADLALSGDVSLGGEVQPVAVLFVDLAGSTELASTRPPHEVVGLLNAFFGVVVDAVNEGGGWINKFEGDAALAIFGAPAELDDASGRALAVARRLAYRLVREVPDLRAGIGVSAGPVVAGYIGAEQRFEYTVIGDPVNEAARLSDLAKGFPGGVLASGSVINLAEESETSLWELGRSVTLRGRSRPTRLAQPLEVAEEPPPARRTPLWRRSGSDPVLPLPHRRARRRLIRTVLQVAAALARPRDPDL